MARRLLVFAFATCVLALPHAAHAQRGQQVFDFFLQQAERELQRQQQRDWERHQQQEQHRLHQQFLAHWHGCHQNDLAACDQALAYPHLSYNDRQRLLAQRSHISTAQQEAEERARQQRIAAEIEERRRDDANKQRLQAEQAERDRPQALLQQGAVRLQDLNGIPVMLGAVGHLLGLTVIGAVLLVLFLFRNPLLARARRLSDLLNHLALSAAPAPAAPHPTSGAQPAPVSPLPQSMRLDESRSASARPPPLPPPIGLRDTVGALAAMELAHAYIDEVRIASVPAPDDKEGRKQQLNTLSLAARQIDAAAKFDPDAVLEVLEGDDVAYRFTLGELKAEALLLEGLTHQMYDTRRAIPALIAATEANPSSPRAFYSLGLIHAANRNKAAAVAAFHSAVALDPKNITYRKELNRVESLTTAEIAGYKATRAGERIYDAGIVTANAGIMAWNIFAFTWNVVTFPLRLALKIAGHR